MSAAATPGLVALGDSITFGRGEPMLELPCQSWAQWLAESLELPFTRLAREGATTADVRREQLNRLRGGYALGALYTGVNDVRSPDWDAERFRADYAACVTALREHCSRVLLCTIPLDLGRPRTGAVRLGEANAVIGAHAGADVRIAALEDLRGWRWVLADAVHLTALGQLELARRGAQALGELPPAVVPRGSLARHLVFGRLPDVARDARRRLDERLRS
ncbi:MAG: hypothetical protein NVS1B9_04770 [Solirubrobacteraceae bacterium]